MAARKIRRAEDAQRANDESPQPAKQKWSRAGVDRGPFKRSGGGQRRIPSLLWLTSL